MKKSTTAILIIIVLAVIAGIVMYGRRGGDSDGDLANASTTPPSAETTKVSSELSEYKNSELGFAVKYPTAWEADKTDSGVSFIMPIDKSQVSTVAKLQADVMAVSGKCTFPPVTTVKERSTVAVKDLSFNMISMTNTVQGRTYFNRMYSLEKDNICYFFSFASIALNPTASNLSGSNMIQAQNNNKAIINTADTAFTNMVKSFSFVTGPQGVDETKAPR